MGRKVASIGLRAKVPYILSGIISILFRTGVGGGAAGKVRAGQGKTKTVWKTRQ